MVSGVESLRALGLKGLRACGLKDLKDLRALGLEVL